MLLHEDEDEDEEACLPVFHASFSSNFLHAVTFLHVLHLDVLRRQIEIETESKSLMYGYNAGPPMAIPIYTVLPYCVIYMYIHVLGEAI